MAFGPGSQQKQIVEGLYRNTFPQNFEPTVFTYVLARGLLGLDGSLCPGANELDEATKKALRDAAVMQPPKRGD